MQFQESLVEEEREEVEAEAVMDEMEALAKEVHEAGKELPTVGTRKLFNQAEAHMKAGKMEDAEVVFLQIVEIDESHLDAHHKLGLLYMKREDFPQAELYFSKLVNLKKDPTYLSNLGTALYSQQRLVEAAEAYERAIALDDKRGNRLKSLGQIYHELGEDEKALHYFQRAASRKPKDEELIAILEEYMQRGLQSDKDV